jgi:hypothetical protein
LACATPGSSDFDEATRHTLEVSQRGSNADSPTIFLIDPSINENLRTWELGGWIHPRKSRKAPLTLRKSRKGSGSSGKAKRGLAAWLLLCRIRLLVMERRRQMGSVSFRIFRKARGKAASLYVQGEYDE